MKTYHHTFYVKEKNLELLENFKNVLILNMKLFIFIIFMDLDKLQQVTWQQ